jgi:RimJ/RimL family protein N-acetyltransferase
MIIIETDRLILRTWWLEDFIPFAELNQDAKVIEFFPALLDQAGAREFIDRIQRQ